MTRVRAEFIAPADPRWRALLERIPHDIYHLPEYVETCARHEGGEPGAFLATNGATEFLLPLLLRKLPAELEAPTDWRDLSSPYGYPGPLTSDPCDAEMPARALRALRDMGRAAAWITAFVRLHPLLPLPPGGWQSAGELQTHGPVAWLDLSRSAEELWAQTRENHRRGIRRLCKLGFHATMDDWEQLPHFVRLYEATMRRVEAAAFYYFPAAYYEDLRTALGERLHLCTVWSPEGDVAAAGLFFETDRIVEYHLGGTATAYLSRAPAKLVMDTVIRWARERGNRILHLGGGLGGREDSLLHFKTGFTPLRAHFHTLRLVLDEARHTELLRRCASPSTERFFPAYRAPAAVVRQ